MMALDQPSLPNTPVKLDRPRLHASRRVEVNGLHVHLNCTLIMPLIMPLTKVDGEAEAAAERRTSLNRQGLGSLQYLLGNV